MLIQLFLQLSMMRIIRPKVLLGWKKMDYFVISNYFGSSKTNQDTKQMIKQKAQSARETTNQLLTFSTIKENKQSQLSSQNASLQQNIINSNSHSTSIDLKKQMMKQKAKAARETIKFLSTFPTIETLKKNQLSSQNAQLQSNNLKSLSELIIKNLSDKQIKKETINQFKEMFDPEKGIQLPMHLTVQKRITDGMKGKFVFFPNRLVTVQVFRGLIEFQNKTLLYGPAGISKTTAIVFYCYLNYIINSYEFEYDQVVAPEIPRMIYLSYERVDSGSSQWKNVKDLQNDQLNYVTQCITSHFPPKIAQNLAEQKQKTSTITQFYKLIKKLFLSKNLKFRVVFDQFNSFVALCRECNQLIYLSQQKKLKNPKNLKVIRKIQVFDENIWLRAAQIFSRQAVLYNSSQNIQDQILDKMRYPYISLNMNHHSKISKIYVNYFDKIKEIQGKRQIVRMLFFDMKRFLNTPEIISKINHLETQIMKSDQFFQKIMLINLTPLQIRQTLFLSNSVQIQQILQDYDFNNNQQVAQTIIKVIEKNFYRESIYLAQKFCNQGSDQLSLSKIVVLYFIRKLITKNKMTLNENNFIKIREQDFHQFNFSLKKEMLDKNLFEINFYGITKIQLTIKFPVSDFLQITSFVQKLLFKQIIDKFTLALDLLIKICGNNKSFLGILVEGIYLYFFTTYNCKLTISQPTKKSSQQITSFLIQKRSQFLHFNSQQKFLQKRLQELIKGKQTILGQPITNKRVHSVNSESFDFIISKPQSKRMIYSFDLTVTSDPNKIKQKKQNAKTMIKKIFSKYNAEESNLKFKDLKITNWKHYIISNCKNENQLVQDFKTDIKIKIKDEDKDKDKDKNKDKNKNKNKNKNKIKDEDKDKNKNKNKNKDKDEDEFQPLGKAECQIRCIYFEDFQFEVLINNLVSSQKQNIEKLQKSLGQFRSLAAK